MAGVRLERDEVGSVTRVRLRRKDGEPDRAFGGGLRVEAGGTERGDVRASSRFSMGEGKGELERELDGDIEKSGVAEGLVWPYHRKTGYGDLWGDCCELGGGAGMSTGDRVRLIWRVPSLVRRRTATLLELFMSRSKRRFRVVEIYMAE